MEKRMVLEIMKIFIVTIQGNGKMTNEMEQEKRNLKINQKNMLVILLKINTMEKENLQHSNQLMKVNLKMGFLKVMAKLDLTMDKFLKAHSKRVKNILEGILILMVATMMGCLEIVCLMELESSFGLMDFSTEGNGSQVCNKE